MPKNQTVKQLIIPDILFHKSVISPPNRPASRIFPVLAPYNEQPQNIKDYMNDNYPNVFVYSYYRGRNMPTLTTNVLIRKMSKNSKFDKTGGTLFVYVEQELLEKNYRVVFEGKGKNKKPFAVEVPVEEELQIPVHQGQDTLFYVPTGKSTVNKKAIATDLIAKPKKTRKKKQFDYSGNDVTIVKKKKTNVVDEIVLDKLIIEDVDTGTKTVFKDVRASFLDEILKDE